MARPIAWTIAIVMLVVGLPTALLKGSEIENDQASIERHVAFANGELRFQNTFGFYPGRYSIRTQQKEEEAFRKLQKLRQRELDLQRAFAQCKAWCDETEVLFNRADAELAEALELARTHDPNGIHRMYRKQYWQ